MHDSETRIEKDSMGEVRVPRNALYGAQTQRAIENFAVSHLQLPRAFIRSLGLIKAAVAQSNGDLGLLEKDMVSAICEAAGQVIDGTHDSQFPVDVFQTGSGTSSNMNANEVIANLATGILGKQVHPNDHVNMGQSSNDVIPTAIHVSASIMLTEELLPSLQLLADTISVKADELKNVIKTGRTHLMDAMPVTMGQELSAWHQQIISGIDRINDTQARVRSLPQGGTAVGSGINAHPRLAELFNKKLSNSSGIGFSKKENFFEGLSTQDTAVELSGQLKTISVGLMKISNDLRWMNSGPLAGLGEIVLPALQPGSSIMPGKVNPVIPESVCMVCAQVIGNDSTITIAGQSGNFQLNVMLPVIAYNLLQSIEILANASSLLAEKAIKGFTVNSEQLNAALEKNPVLVTALNRAIGYEMGAKIVKQAYEKKLPIRQVVAEMTDLDNEEIDKLLDPVILVKGGIVE